MAVFSVVVIGMTIFSYMLWRGIGPRTWYLKDGNQAATVTWKSFGRCVVPNTAGFALALVTLCLEAQTSGVVHVLAAITLGLTLACFGLGGVVFVTGWPKQIIPPAFRD